MATHAKKQKLYCYVDETGQDTRGRLFVVAVVIASDDRERVRDLLRHIEQLSGKGRKKWTRATLRQRQKYMERVIQVAAFQKRLFYTRFTQTTDYLRCAFQTIARALTIAATGQRYEATVLIDGLSKHEQHKVGSELRHLRVAVRKVRGLRDESDEFIRLADATAGFVRDYLEGDAPMVRIYQEAVQRGVLQEVGQ